MESALKEVAAAVGLACELAAVLVAAIGAMEAVVRLAMGGRRVVDLPIKRVVWVRFAAWILLSLEFALAADIVRSAIAPTWDDIGQLAAIAAIRTLLNFFLARDLETAAEDERRAREAGPRPAT